MILALDAACFEFIPLGEKTQGTGRALECHELEKGKRYKTLLYG